jgi:hypothetical protein
VFCVVDGIPFSMRWSGYASACKLCSCVLSEVYPSLSVTGFGICVRHSSYGHEVWSIGVFSSGLGIGVFVNKKRLAKYLLGGVLLVALLIGVFLLWYYGTGQNTVRTPRQPVYCEDVVGPRCAIEPESSFNLSEIERCSSPNYRSIQNLPSVEDVNESTGIVTCDTSGANTSN